MSLLSWIHAQFLQKFLFCKLFEGPVINVKNVISRHYLKHSKGCTLGGSSDQAICAKIGIGLTITVFLEEWWSFLESKIFLHFHFLTLNIKMSVSPYTTSKRVYENHKCFYVLIFIFMKKIFFKKKKLFTAY